MVWGAVILGVRWRKWIPRICFQNVSNYTESTQQCFAAKGFLDTNLFHSLPHCVVVSSKRQLIWLLILATACSL